MGPGECRRGQHGIAQRAHDTHSPKVISGHICSMHLIHVGVPGCPAMKVNKWHSKINWIRSSFISMITALCLRKCDLEIISRKKRSKVLLERYSWGHGHGNVFTTNQHIQITCNTKPSGWWYTLDMNRTLHKLEKIGITRILSWWRRFSFKCFISPFAIDSIFDENRHEIMITLSLCFVFNSAKLCQQIDIHRITVIIDIDPTYS